MMFICNLSNVSLYPDDGQWDNRQEYMTLVLMTIKILFLDLDGEQIIFECIRTHLYGHIYGELQQYK